MFRRTLAQTVLVSVNVLSG